METYKPELDDQQKLDRAEKVAAALKNGGKLLIQITHVSQSNMSYRYKVNLAEWDGKEIQLTNLTYWLAAEWNERAVKAWAGDELKGQGIGTNRYFLAAYNLGLTLKNYGLIDDVYSVADRRVYQEI
jgi:hypothetical protein